MNRNPRHRPTPSDRNLAYRLIAACGSQRALAARFAGAGDQKSLEKRIYRVVSEQESQASCPPKTRAMLEKMERELFGPVPVAGVRADSEGSLPLEELIELMIASQQTSGAIGIDQFCDICCRQLQNPRASIVEQNAAAVLMAQIGFLRGSKNRFATFRLCEGFLRQMVDAPCGEFSDFFRSVAQTALARAQCIYASQIANLPLRIAAIIKAIKMFEEVLFDAPRPLHIPAFPLLWTQEEHPNWEWASNDTLRRTALTRYAGRPLRYLIWMNLLLAFEFLRGSQASLEKANRALTKAEFHFQRWRDSVVKDSPSAALHLSGRAWKFRLNCLRYVVFDRSDDRRQKLIAMRALEKTIMEVKASQFVSELEMLSAEAIVAPKSSNVLHNPALLTGPLFNLFKSGFHLDVNDMHLHPLARMFELSADEHGLREVKALLMANESA